MCGNYVKSTLKFRHFTPNLFFFIHLVGPLSALDRGDRKFMLQNNGQNFVHTNKGGGIRFGRPPPIQYKFRHNITPGRHPSTAPSSLQPGRSVCLFVCHLLGQQPLGLVHPLLVHLGPQPRIGQGFV